MKTIFNFTLTVAAFSLLAVQQLVAQTPVAYWNFDDVYDVDADTVASDSSGNGYDAVWQYGQTTPDWEQGILGGAVHFPSGSGIPAARNFFETTTALTQLQNSNGMSISAWINPDSTGAYDGVVMTRSIEAGPQTGLNFGIAVEKGSDPVDAHIDSRAGGQALDSTPDSITSDNGAANSVDGWQHVVWAWDNPSFGPTNTTVFINGVESSSALVGFGFGTALTNGGLWAIGTDPGAPNDRIFDGLVDDVAIFAEPLDQTQAQAIYDDGIAGMNLSGGTYPAVGQGTTINSITSNYRTDVTSRADGDLNWDGFVDAADFRLFKDNLPPLAGGGVNVPEPTSLALLGLAAACSLGLRRKGQRSVVTLALLFAVAISTGGEAIAQDVSITVNRETKAITVNNNDAASIDLDLYEVRSESGALNSSNGAWTSLFDAGFGLNGWAEANPSSNLLAEVNSTAVTTLTEAGGVEPSFSIGTPFDPEPAKAAAGFGVEVEDLVFVYSGPTIGINTGTVEYVGDKEFNTLVVNVNPGTGAIEIENESPFEVTLSSYQISSPAGALDSSWAGIRASDADWDAIGSPSANQIAELDGPTGTGLVVPAAGTVSLGSAYMAGAAVDEGLAFTFGLIPEPMLLGQTEFVGGVKFDTPPVGGGDFNGDGDTDGADFLAWQRGESPNGATLGDLALWQADYPTPLSGLGGVTAVPEPSTLMLIAASLALLPSRRVRS